MKPDDGRIVPIDGPLGTLLDGIVMWTVILGGYWMFLRLLVLSAGF